jgi:thymus-specific serine protease
LKDLANDQNGNNCLQVDWNQTLDFIKDPQKGQMGGLRSWYWQTCTEFGFFQTCEEGTQCPYAKGYHTLHADLQVCEYAFGIDASEVKESILQTHEYYGDNLLEGGSRILSVNGDVDPWATLARTNDTPNSNDPMLPTFMVEGASHHFWTHAVKDSDSPFVFKARALIYATVTQWLELDAEDSNSVQYDI